MGKTYTQSTASLKTVIHDTRILDAHKIMIYPGAGDSNTRIDLLNIIDSATENCAKIDVANIFTMPNSFNSDLTVTGTSTFVGQVSLPASTTGTTGITDPTPDQILTTQDNDYRYAQLKVENIFEEVNNFEKHVNFGSSVETNGAVKVNSGGVVLSADGYVSFNDDGLVTTPSGAKGYPYSEGIPTVLQNGGIYNLGIITEPIDISGVYFDGDDTIIQTCEVWFEQGSTVNAITWMPDLYWIDTSNGKAPTWIAKLRYRVAIRKEIDRLIGSVSYSYSI